MRAGSPGGRHRPAKTSGGMKSASQSAAPLPLRMVKWSSDATTGTFAVLEHRRGNEHERHRTTNPCFTANSKGNDGRELFHLELSAIFILEDRSRRRAACGPRTPASFRD